MCNIYIFNLLNTIVLERKIQGYNTLYKNVQSHIKYISSYTKIFIVKTACVHCLIIADIKFCIHSPNQV